MLFLQIYNFINIKYYILFIERDQKAVEKEYIR